MGDKVFGKQKSCNYVTFAKGGSGHMIGKHGATAQKPQATTSQHGAMSKGPHGTGGPYGGSGHMLGYSGVKASKAL